MKVFGHPYQLTPRSFLHSQDTQASPRKGLLIKIVDGDQFGISDLCPFTSLGDFSVEKQVKYLLRNELSPIIQQSLFFALVDMEYRRQWRGLFENLTPPLSHKTIPDFTRCDFRAELERARQQGFKAIKIKVGKNEQREIDTLTALSPQEMTDLKLRLDFNNNCQNPEIWTDCLRGLAVECVEDPFSYEEQNWSHWQRTWQTLLFWDRQPGLQNTWTAGQVYKPAVQPFDRLNLSAERFLVTAYMDHPIGQTFAAWVAALLQKQFPEKYFGSGLLTQDLYFETRSWLPAVAGPQFASPEGYGVGFANHVQSLSWEFLCHLNGRINNIIFSAIPEFIQKTIFEG